VDHREGRDGCASCIRLHIERLYEKNEACARLMALVVDSEHRGRDVGQDLIFAAEDWARRKGAGDLMLTTYKRRTGHTASTDRCAPKPRDTASAKSSRRSLYCTAILSFALSARRLRAMI
jgi:GNAT superfamily N-acetyltransferase